MPTDITRRGSREYSSDEYSKVVQSLRDAICSLNTDELAKITGIPGRTVRAVISAADGVEFVLAGGDEGYRIAARAEETDALNARLESQARKMLERVARRKAFTA